SGGARRHSRRLLILAAHSNGTNTLLMGRWAPSPKATCGVVRRAASNRGARGHPASPQLKRLRTRMAHRADQAENILAMSRTALSPIEAGSARCVPPSSPPDPGDTGVPSDD